MPLGGGVVDATSAKVVDQARRDKCSLSCTHVRELAHLGSFCAELALCSAVQRAVPKPQRSECSPHARGMPGSVQARSSPERRETPSLGGPPRGCAKFPVAVSCRSRAEGTVARGTLSVMWMHAAPAPWSSVQLLAGPKGLGQRMAQDRHLGGPGQRGCPWAVRWLLRACSSRARRPQLGSSATAEPPCSERRGKREGERKETSGRSLGLRTPGVVVVARCVRFLHVVLYGVTNVLENCNA